MADPISTVVTVISEHPQAAAVAASMYGVIKPFLTRILGPSADELGEIGRDFIKGKRASNAGQMLGSADKLLADVGREAQMVPLATLVPLLEGASLQDEPSLANKWAALLANAADPAQRVSIGRGFVEVLQQLEPADALVLERIYQAVRLDDRDALTWESAPVHTQNFGKELGLEPKQFAISIDMLLRLRLCALPTPRKRTLDNGFEPTSAATFQVCPTVFGREFLAACTPPTA